MAATEEKAMTHAERFRAVMNFQPVDRLPCIEWATWWDQTIERWVAEGLPTSDRYEIYEYLGLDPYYQYWFGPRGPTCPRPASHGAGIVANSDDYHAIRQYLYPPFEEAIEGLRPWAERQERGDGVVWVTLEGFFWFPRSLLGIEKHFYAFYDQPELVHCINRDLTDYHLRLLHALSRVCRPSFLTIAEDMSFNHGPMLSQTLFDEFIAPYYRQITPRVKEMGAYTIVDSDGDISEMVPWMQAAGIEGVLPLERQAGVDGMRLRDRFPHWRMIGHFDKMVMTRGEPALRAEFERLLPLMRTGGFIPSVDHQTPPGVSLEQYCGYLRLLKEYCALSPDGAGTERAG
jgi:uroporphyrinogen decarboxylase-like protein